MMVSKSERTWLDCQNCCVYEAYGLSYPTVLEGAAPEGADGALAYSTPTDPVPKEGHIMLPISGLTRFLY